MSLICDVLSRHRTAHNRRSSRHAKKAEAMVKAGVLAIRFFGPEAEKILFRRTSQYRCRTYNKGFNSI